MMRNKLSERGANDGYEMSQADIAEKMFLHTNTIINVEKRAMENFRKIMEERGITIEDLLEY